ncbi:MAG: hypothetical protein LAT64_10490 [Phycisphaerales bacterium]|nr:hypothetical protein [Planctomycetota bacterium]MCH8509179.1 hypothetical protein [Phycisphaerales bacterium]
MRVIMDGQTISEDAPGVAQALELARAKADELGRLVIEVQADGEPAADLLDRMPEDAAGVTELGVVTAEKSLFLRETLLEARDALERTRQDQQRAAELIDSGEVAQALGSLRGIVEGWQVVRSVIDQAATLAGVPITQIKAGEATGDRVVRDLAADLVALRDAVSKEDWSALSDTLACDLDERAGMWLAMIDALAERAVQPVREADTA